MAVPVGLQVALSVGLPGLTVGLRLFVAVQLRLAVLENVTVRCREPVAVGLWLSLRDRVCVSVAENDSVSRRDRVGEPDVDGVGVPEWDTVRHGLLLCVRD